MAAAGSTGADVDHLVHPQARWQALAGLASAGLSRCHCWSCALLVGREIRRAHTLCDHHSPGRSASGPAHAQISVAPATIKARHNTTSATLRRESGFYGLSGSWAMVRVSAFLKIV